MCYLIYWYILAREGIHSVLVFRQDPCPRTSVWRLLGVADKELFRLPYLSTSLKEFWGKKWNMAFSEMTALIVYRPLKTKYDRKTAVISAFLMSGLLHEIAISGPANAGYGLPMLYFILHAAAMYAEDHVSVVKRIVAHPMRSRVWVFGWLLGAMFLLFHGGFMNGVLIPLRQLILEKISL